MAKLSTAAMALLLCLDPQTSCIRQTIHTKSSAKQTLFRNFTKASAKQTLRIKSEANIETLDIDGDFKYNQTFEGGDWESDDEGLLSNRSVDDEGLPAILNVASFSERKARCARSGICDCRGKMCVHLYKLDSSPIGALCEYKLEPTKCSIRYMNTCKNPKTRRKERLCWIPKHLRTCTCDPREFNAAVGARYTWHHIIAKGAFGTVVKATTPKRKDVAVKFIPRELWTSALDDEVELYTDAAEVNPWIPNVVEEKIELGCKRGVCNQFFITDYVAGGTLSTYWKDKFENDNGIPEGTVRQILSQLAKAVAGLHGMDPPIVHRDIKLANIMYDDSNRPKLALLDFGFATEFTGEMLTRRCGTPTFVAPELFSQSGYSMSVDIWSMGVILYMLVFGNRPFIAPETKDLVKRIRDPSDNPVYNTSTVLPAHWPQGLGDVQELLQNMLEKDPEKRFDINDVLGHTWVKG